MKRVLLIPILFAFLGCIQLGGRREIEQPACGNYLPRGWICPPSQEFISKYNLTKVDEVEVNSPIELYNFTIIPILNRTSILVENIPKSILFALAELFLTPTLQIFTRLAILPLELLLLGNITIEDLKQRPDVRVYEAGENKEFAVVYLILENRDDYEIRGGWEGFLVTEGEKYSPKYILRHDRLWPTEQLNNYTIFELARYSVGPNSTGITFFVFEVGKGEEVVEFIFNTTYQRCELLCFGDVMLKNMVVKLQRVES